MIELHTKYKFSPAEDAELRQLVQKDLVMTASLCTKTHEKLLESYKVTGDSIQFGWNNDEYR